MSATTQMDANQVIKKVYDEASGALKVTGPGPIASRLAADTDSVSLGDVTATNFLAPNPDGSLPITDNAGSLTVDNAGTFAVQATLDAETTKVIGTVNQGTSPWVTSGTVTTTPATVDTTVWFNAVDASMDQVTTSANCLAYRVVGVMADWDSLDQADSTLQFQGSVDGSLWENVGGATTLASPGGKQSFSLIDEPYKAIRLVYIHGTVSTGTVTAKYIMRA